MILINTVRTTLIKSEVTMGKEQEKLPRRKRISPGKLPRKGIFPPKVNNSPTRMIKPPKIKSIRPIFSNPGTIQLPL
jgi:hypothetical protein